MAFPLMRNLFSRTIHSHERLAYVIVGGSRKCSSTTYSFKTLSVKKPHEHVLQVELNRPDKLNSVNQDLWSEFLQCFKQIQRDKECRVVVLSAAGRIFTSGLDFGDMGELMSHVTSDEDVARKAVALQPLVEEAQDCFTSLEKCMKPVITAVHGACVGAGVDMISAADIRYCSEDAWFQIKEVDIGMAADVGTLQRFPRIVGNDSLVREYVYTARRISSAEALKIGLVSQVFPTKEDTVQAALELAKVIASKSPVAVQGSKVNLIYSRDHSVPESLKFMTYWNMTMLQSEDLMKASMNVISRESEPPEFKDL